MPEHMAQMAKLQLQYHTSTCRPAAAPPWGPAPPGQEQPLQAEPCHAGLHLSWATCTRRKEASYNHWLTPTALISLSLDNKGQELSVTSAHCPRSSQLTNQSAHADDVLPGTRAHTQQPEETSSRCGPPTLSASAKCSWLSVTPLRACCAPSSWAWKCWASTLSMVASILKGCAFLGGYSDHASAWYPGAHVAVPYFCGWRRLSVGPDQGQVHAHGLPYCLWPQDLVHRELQPPGNNDGQNPLAPTQFRSKEVSKSSVVYDVLVHSDAALYLQSEEPGHCMVIRHVGNSKRVLD
ncbi:hypothetical protein R6Z07M_008862 [Ovis aries]